MKPILLHIGSTKTGTSSVQRTMHNNADVLAAAGVLYPRAGRGRPNRSAHHNLCYELQEKQRLAQTFDPVRGTWADALDEIDSSPADVGLISSEAFSMCEPDHVGALAAVLAGRHVTIIVYLRRQDRWLQSYWNQRARFGRADLDFWRWFDDGGHVRARYDHMMASFVSHFGADRVSLRLFDNIAPGSDAVEDFTRAYVPQLDLRGDHQTRKNAKAGLKQLTAVAAVVAECRNSLGEGFILSQRSAMRISDFFRDRAGEQYRYSVISYEQALAIQARYRDANERLFAEVEPANGPGFPSPQPDEFGTYLDLSSPPLDLFDEEERRFVQRMAREIVRST